MSDFDTQINVGMNVEGVVTGTEKAKRSLKDLNTSARESGKSIDGMGDGGSKAADKVEAATRSMIGSIQRQTAALDAGDKSSRKYQESLAKMRGVDVNALKPYLDQLDAAKMKQDIALNSQNGLIGGFGGIGTAAIAAGAAFVAAAAGVATMTKKVIDGLDALNDLKDATGASIENISAIEDVALRTGASFDVVSTSLIKLNQGLNNAKPGSDTENAINAIGLSVKDLKALDTAEAFRQIAVGLSGFADDANKARLTQELFGKSLKEVAPLLNDLAAAGSLVATVTAKEAEEAEKFNKELFNLSKTALDAARDMAGPLVSAINETIQLFREGAKEGKSFYSVLVDEQLRLLGLKDGPKEYAKRLNDISRELESGNIHQTKRNALLREQAAIQAKFSATPVTSYEETELARLARAPKPTVGNLPDQAAIKAAAAASAKALAELNKELAAQTKLLAENAGLTGTFANDWDRLAAIYKKGGISLEQLSEAQAKLLADQPAIKAAKDAEVKAAELIEKANKAAFESRLKHVESLGSGLDKLQEEVNKQAEYNDRLGLTKEAIAELDAAKLELQATDLDSIAIKKLDRDLDEEQYDLYKKQATELRNLARLKRVGGEKEAAIESAKAASAEWKKGWEETDRLARDVFTTWATDGSNAAQKIGDTLKKALLSAIYEATIKPIALQLYTSFTGGGTGGITGIASQTANSLNGVGSALKSIGNYADAFNGSGLRNLANSSIGQSMGLSTAGVYRPALDAMGAPTLTSAGELFSAMPVGGMLVAYSKGGIGGFASGVASTAAAGAISGGLAASAAGTGVAAGAMGGASAALAAVPVWGWAAMAALAVLGNKGDAETKYGGNFASDAAGNISQTLGNGTGGNMANQAMEKGIALTTQTINSLLKSVGSAAKVAAFSAGGQSDEEKPEGYSFAGGTLSNGTRFGDAGYQGDNLGIANPEQVMKAYGEDLQRATLDAIQSAADIPASIADMLKDVDIEALSGTALSDLGAQVINTIQAVEALRGAVGGLSFDEAAEAVAQVGDELKRENETTADAVRRLGTDLTGVNAVFASVGRSLLDMSVAGAATASSMVAAAGGLANFQAQVTAMYSQLDAARQAFADANRNAYELQAQAESDANGFGSTSGGGGGGSSSNDALAEAVKYLADTKISIQAWLDNLNSTDAGGLSADAQRTSAWASLQSQLTLARGGDRDALSGITGYADSYINTINKTSKTEAEARLAIGKVRGQLAALPGQVSPEQFIVDAINANGGGAGAVATAVKSLGSKLTAELTVSARSEIVKMIEFVVDTDKLPYDLKQLALASADTMTKTVSFITGSKLSEENKQIALSTESLLTKTVSYALGQDIPDEYKKLALKTSDSISKTISYIARNMLDPKQTEIALMADNSIVKTIEMASKFLDADALKVAYAQSEVIRKMLEVSGGVLTPEQTLLLDNISQYNKTINLFVAMDGTALDSAKDYIKRTLGTLDIEAVITGLPTTDDTGGLIPGQDVHKLLGGYINDLGKDGLIDGTDVGLIVGIVKRFGGTMADIAKATGWSLQQVIDFGAAWGIPAFAMGTDYIPRDMLAMVHKGEQIVPAAYNPHANGTAPGGASQTALVEEIRALRTDNQAQALALVQLQKRMNKLLERWDGNGMPETRVVTA